MLYYMSFTDYLGTIHTKVKAPAVNTSHTLLYVLLKLKCFEQKQ